MVDPNLLLLDTYFKSRSQKLLMTESMTAGSLSRQVMFSPNSGSYFLGSLVCYDSQMKTKWLGVDAALIRRHTAESMAVTQALLDGLMNNHEADVFVAVTGLAYPSLQAEQHRPVGTVYYAFGSKHYRFKKKTHFKGTAEQIVHQCCQSLWSDLLHWLKGLPEE
jgi:nicotinamide-nucleotide amidase